MSTLSKLQAHLSGETMTTKSGYVYKQVAPAVHCADGTTLSVQASETHYCTPRDNEGPYIDVEVWYATRPTDAFFESDEGGPSAYVPIGQVVAYIDSHGGFQ